MRLKLLQWLFVALLCLVAVAQGAEQPFPFRDQETTVFFGDSITYAGFYTEYVESFLVTRFPEKDFRVFNAGRNSDTLSGTTEFDHPGPRPNGHDRFATDVAAMKPTLIVACFGMNDGNYSPLEPERFGKFKAGVDRLIERTRKETNARLIILTPPTFDSRTAGRPDVRPPETYGYKLPFANYDQVLGAYSEWSMGRAAQDVTVVDVHSHMREHLLSRRRTLPQFTLQPDQVHPDATGHMVMAAALLKSWRVPASASEASVDAKAMKVLAGSVARLSKTNNLIEFYWTARLPMPMDDRWDAGSLGLENLKQSLNQHRLTIRGLPAGNYRLFADNEVVAHFSDFELGGGVDLLMLKQFPTVLKSRRVLALIEERRKLEREGRRKRPANSTEAYNPGDDWTNLHIRLKLLCRPLPVRIRLIPENK